LQPSPTLRWHPWAPLVAGFLALAFVLFLATRWGYMAGARMADQRGAFAVPVLEWMHLERNETQPGWMTVTSARQLDGLVLRWMRDHEARQSPATRARLAAEEVLFGSRVDGSAVLEEGARNMAEYRLKALSGAAPLWQRTAAVCKELGAGIDMRSELDKAAKAYTALLGREITPQQLAPLSGAVCT
jgi:hypothetical protein